MSRIHIQFTREAQTDLVVTYVVTSSDFDESRRSEPIARIEIDRIEKSYRYFPLGRFLTEKVIPPHVFNLPSAEQERALQQEFRDHGYGGWTSRIARVAQSIVERGEFPDEAFGIT